jgi:hypothetical protein
MPRLRLPPDVEAVFRRCFTCEITTINKQGQPLTWPNLPYYDEPNGRIVVTASIAFPVKTYNARRNPKVALLYSDPTGSGLTDPPAVLVQGDAVVDELIKDEYEQLAVDIFVESVRRQPSARQYVGNPLARKLFLFYFQRIGVFVQPRRILVWPHRDFSRPPTEVEVRHVE